MRQIGLITITSTMIVAGLARFSYLTCPICHVAMRKFGKSVYGHLNKHINEGTFPRVISRYVGLLVDNKRGVNQIIDGLDMEKQTAIKSFCKDMYEATHPQGVDFVHRKPVRM